MQRQISLSMQMVVGILTVLMIVSAVVGCAGSSKEDKQAAQTPEAEQKGSLSRTFTLVDEQERKSGTLIMHPSGGAELRDENGQVIGKFSFTGTTAAEPAAAPASEMVEPVSEYDSTEMPPESEISGGGPDDTVKE